MSKTLKTVNDKNGKKWKIREKLTSGDQKRIILEIIFPIELFYSNKILGNYRDRRFTDACNNGKLKIEIIESPKKYFAKFSCIRRYKYTERKNT